MTDTLLDLSGKLPDALVESFRRVVRATAAVGAARWFVVGAQARDLLLRYRYNLQSSRATNDVDFAVAVESWGEYDALREALITAEGFTAHPTLPQRLILAGNIIDIVPFGSLENPPGRISWPPDSLTVMSTIGFREAYDHALKVRLASDVVVMVASLAGFALLKIIAWSDRRFERDAQDLGFLMRCYLDAGNQDRLFTEHADLLREDFDYEVASARVLGRDIAAVLTTESRDVIAQILAEETDEEGQLALAAAMVRNNANFSGDIDTALSRLIMLYRGVLDSGQP